MGVERKQSNVSHVVIILSLGDNHLKTSSFEPSSTAKIELYRYRYGNILKVLLGKHEGKVVDLLENGVY